MSNQLSAVLIAGHTRFMKSPPHRLDFGGVPILSRTLDAFANFEEIVVVTLGETSPIEEAAGERAKMVHLPDENAKIGAQLRAGIEAVTSKKGFAIAICDQAMLTQAQVDDFAKRFLDEPNKIFVPICQRHIGMPSIFPSSLLKEFQALGDDDSAWPIVRDHGDSLQEMEIFETSITRHIEDMDDYHEMLRISGIPLPDMETEGSRS